MLLETLATLAGHDARFNTNGEYAEDDLRPLERAGRAARAIAAAASPLALYSPSAAGSVSSEADDAELLAIERARSVIVDGAVEWISRHGSARRLEATWEDLAGRHSRVFFDAVEAYFAVRETTMADTNRSESLDGKSAPASAPGKRRRRSRPPSLLIAVGGLVSDLLRHSAGDPRAEAGQAGGHADAYTEAQYRRAFAVATLCAAVWSSVWSSLHRHQSSPGGGFRLLGHTEADFALRWTGDPTRWCCCPLVVACARECSRFSPLWSWGNVSVFSLLILQPLLSGTAVWDGFAAPVEPAQALSDTSSCTYDLAMLPAFLHTMSSIPQLVESWVAQSEAEGASGPHPCVLLVDWVCGLAAEQNEFDDCAQAIVSVLRHLLNVESPGSVANTREGLVLLRIFEHLGRRECVSQTGPLGDKPRINSAVALLGCKSVLHEFSSRNSSQTSAGSFVDRVTAFVASRAFEDGTF
jgi:hypothetical protein